MKKSFYYLLLILSIFALTITSCGGPETPAVYHTVTFESEHSASTTARVEEGKTVTKPKNPTSNDYDFKGWLLNGVAYNFSTPVLSDITLTANWTIKQYKLSFFSLDAKETVHTDITYDKGTAVTLSGIQGVSDYSWSTSVTGEAVTSVTMNSDITLYKVMDEETKKALTAIHTPCVVHGDDNRKLSTMLAIDPDWFFGTADNTKYSKNICSLASMLMMEMYSDCWVEVASRGVTENHDYFAATHDEKKSIFDALNFDNITSKQITKTEGSPDEYDVADFVIASKVYKAGTEDERTLVVVSIKGTTKDKEWLSNADVGYDGTALYGGTTHSEWTNKKNHKGFDVTANRVKTEVNSFIETNCTSGKPVSILITGHSRGAAVANILGAYYEKNTTTAVKDYTIKPFTYTFACPFVTDKYTDTTYLTVFNIINTDDLVPYVPPVKDFTRYGSSVTVDMTSKTNKEAYNKKVGSDYSETNISDWALPTINSIKNHTNGARSKLFTLVTLKDKYNNSTKIDKDAVTEYYKTGAGKSLVSLDGSNNVTAVKPAMFYDILNYAMFGNAKNDFGDMIEAVEDANGILEVVEIITEYTSLLSVYGLTTADLIGIYTDLFGLSIGSKSKYEALGDSIEKAHVAFTYVALTEIYNEK